VAVVVAGVAIGALAAVLILKLLPAWLATDGLTGAEKDEAVGRARTAVLASLAGLIAVVGAIFTGLSYRLNRAGQITERFTRAIDPLGDSALDVRLGGIYALERIARDSKDDHPQVVEVLTAYVREHSPWPKRWASGRAPQPGTGPTEAIRALERIAAGAKPEESAEPSDDPVASEGEDLPPLPTDVQAAMSVLVRRNVLQDRAQLNLAHTDLRRLAFVLSDAEEANLEGANLGGANLQDAKLDEANLQRASLGGAILQDAELDGANLQGAKLVGANLQGAKLVGANLQGAKLVGANLQGAKLVGAILQSANLVGANLHGANLDDANLQDAKLTAANLQDTYLAGTNFQGVSYNTRTIHRRDPMPALLPTQWPMGFTPPPPQ
jgi:uncharacterized protein YjbI with pentapeptide repeats